MYVCVCVMCVQTIMTSCLTFNFLVVWDIERREFPCVYWDYATQVRRIIGSNDSKNKQYC